MSALIGTGDRRALKIGCSCPETVDARRPTAKSKIATRSRMRDGFYMKKLLLLACLLSASLPMAAQTQSWDTTFRGLTEATRIGESMRMLSARPHHLGSPYDKQNAEWILARFKEWGW